MGFALEIPVTGNIVYISGEGSLDGEGVEFSTSTVFALSNLECWKRACCVPDDLLRQTFAIWLRNCDT